LYDVHVGHPYETDAHQDEYYSFDWDKLRRKGDYHSLWALPGRSLRNPEVIVYKEQQSTIRYLVEFE